MKRSLNQNMSHAANFRFEDFTRRKYARLLRAVEKKFVFSSYTEFDSKPNEILWRHDLDFSIHAGLAFAKMEAHLKVKSTYFFLLSSEFYSLLEKSVRSAAKEIVNLGHDVGLHFDLRDHNITNELQLIAALNRDKALLEDILERRVTSFSFHYPRSEIAAFPKLYYAEMVNVYAHKFYFDVKYCSDSNGYWRYERLFNLVKESQGPLHVLTHPEWWSPTVLSPRERILRCATGRTVAQMRYYDQLIKTAGRKNVL